MTYKFPEPLSTYVWFVTVSLCLYGAAVAGQERPAKDQFVRLTVMPESLGAVYTEGLDPAVLQWVYPGEPMFIEFALWNNTLAQMPIDRTAGDWFDLVQLNLMRRESVAGPSVNEGGRDRKLSVTLVGQQRIGQADLSSRQLRLESGSHERVRVRVDEREVAALSPGIYVLRAALDSSVLPAAWRGRLGILQDERLIGIRALETRTDYLNYYAHMATWAKQSKDFGKARSWLSQLLSLNSVSTAAYAQLGNVAFAEGKCAEAVAHWRKAIEILTADGDSEARTAGRSRGEAIMNLNAQLKRCP